MTVLVSRVIPGIRTLISFPAEVARMNLIKFTAYTTAGYLIWNGLLVYASVFRSDSWGSVVRPVEYLGIASILAFVVLMSILFCRANGRKKQL